MMPPASPASRFRAVRRPMILRSPLFSSSPVNSGVNFSQQSIKPPTFHFNPGAPSPVILILFDENSARQLKYRNSLKTQPEKPCHAASAIIESAQLVKPFRRSLNQDRSQGIAIT